MASDYVPVITPLPDDNTSEAIMFGPAYKYAKSSKWYLDELDDTMDERIEELKSQLIDREFCAAIMRRSPMMIYARNPPVSEPDKIRDLWTLRQIVNYGSAKQNVKVMKMVSRLYSTMQGVDQHASQYVNEGVSEQMWKSATIGYDVPIEYETIRTVKEQDERVAAADAESLYTSMDSEDRRREADRIDREVRDYVRSFDEDEEDDYEAIEAIETMGSPRLPNITIYHEYEVSDDIESEEEEDVEENESESASGTMLARHLEDTKGAIEEHPEVIGCAVFDSISAIACDPSDEEIGLFMQSLVDFASSVYRPTESMARRPGVFRRRGATA